LLSRVVIPVEVASKYNYLSKRHIWWVEKVGRSFQLRAKLYVAEATVERELKSGFRRAVWHLDTIRSERITWPGTKGRGGRIGTSLDVVLDNLGGLAFTSVPIQLDRRLEDRRLAISEQVLGFENAARTLRRLFSETRSQIPAVTPSSSSLEQALLYVHAYFAREELVGVSGRDPYEVAAAVLAGYAQMPDEKRTSITSLSCLPAAEIFEFTELDEEHISFVERRWRRNSEAFCRSDKLEVKTKRHQYILQLLARYVRLKGFRPTYNRYVDMRIKVKHDEVLFEVKTADALNFQNQVRYAVGQLLEYRHRYTRHSIGRKIRLAVVVEASASDEQYEFARGLLSELGITMVLWGPNTALFEGLDEVLA